MPLTDAWREKMRERVDEFNLRLHCAKCRGSPEAWWRDEVAAMPDGELRREYKDVLDREAERIPVVYPDLGLAFIHIPRTGGTGVQNWLSGGKEGASHRKSWTTRQALLDGRVTGLVSFSCVRDPFDRALSLICYYLGGGNGDEWDRVISDAVKAYVGDGDAGCAEFVRYARLRPGRHHGDEVGRRLRVMFTPQCRWVFDGDRRAVDFLVPLEQLTEFVSRWSGPLKRPYRAMNGSKRSVRCGESLVRVVSELYGGDVALHRNAVQDREWEHFACPARG